jgi:hypothetical protein
MANKVYPKFKKKLLNGGANVNLLTSNVKLVLVDTGAYTYSDAHEFLSDIPSGARVAQSGNLTGKSVSDLGAFDSDDTSFTAVTGPSSEALVGFVDTGVAGTSPLIWFEDTAVVGLPVTPAGASYNVIADSGGWFVL